MDQLLIDLDQQFKYVLQKLVVDDNIVGLIDEEFRLQHAKYELIPDFSTD